MSLDIGTPPIILNGTTGGILETEVDGQPALVNTTEQPILVELSLEQRIHDLVVVDRKIVAQEDVVADEKAKLKALKEHREETLSAIKRHDDGEFMLPFEPEDRDESEPEDSLD